MTLIEQIRDKIAQHEYEFSEHAVGQSIVRHISVKELGEAIASGEVIEDYPDDKYGPSCLIFGFTLAYRPLVKIITIYEPDPNEWIDFRTRRA